MSDTQWLQASTPVKSGGLGIQCAASLELPAFLASAVATSDLQSAILSRREQNVDKEVELARSRWCSLTSTPPAVSYLQASQIAWDAPLVARDLETLVDNVTSDADKANKKSRPQQRVELCFADFCLRSSR